MNAAVESWRAELAAQAGLTAEIRRELEAHLQDCIAGFQRGGLSDHESFQLARQRIGQPRQLGTEFKKAMNTNSHWSRPLTFGAWALFAISFFLPTLNEARGYQCAMMQNLFWDGTMRGEWISIHYELLTLANVLMLASPFLFMLFSRNTRQLLWLHHLILAATILVWAFVVQLIIHQENNGLRIGCFVWSTSFALLYLSVLFQLNALRKDAAHKNA